ncbi:MAG: proton extrusion protein PcxA, partial [Microcystis sp.]
MPWNRVNQWVERRSLVALESAYQRALKIKAIEDKHFGGQK